MLHDREGAKYVRITCRAHLHDAVVGILDNFGEAEYTTCPPVSGADGDGRHSDAALRPGGEEVISIRVPGALARPLFDALVVLKKKDPACRDMRIAVIPVERCG